MRGYQCLKYIYLSVHHKELESPVTIEQQVIFNQGNLVGEAARKLFAQGVLVDNKPWDFVGSLKKTRELLSNKTPIIFEAAFDYQGCYARADIIEYNSSSERWTIYEVKSSTKVKEEQLDDVALQAWIMAKSGLPIEKIFIMHLNPNCIHPNLTELFIQQEVTELVRLRYPLINQKINQLFSALRKSETPEISIGSQCLSPNPCSFKEHCWSQINWPEFSVFDLPKIGDKKWDYLLAGQLDLKEISIENLDPLQSRIIDCVKSNKNFIDIKAIKSEIAQWSWPLIFLDFETINPAIPRYPGSSPYQQIPFQFSIHIWPNLESSITSHYEYLHQESSDPRPTLLKNLIPLLKQPGTIVAYYKQFEIARLQEMALQFKDYEADILSIIERVQDPLPIIRSHIYDLAFKGSFSLKAVAPALLGQSFSYHNLSVDNGMAAQRAFEEIINPNTDASRKEELIKASLIYCQQDTQVMVELTKWMFNLSND